MSGKREGRVEDILQEACRELCLPAEATGSWNLQGKAEPDPAEKKQDASEKTLLHLPTDHLFEALLRQKLKGEDPEKLAWLFHAGLARFITDSCIEIAEASGIRTAALTGGCFQNRLLLSLVQDSLTERGMEVLIHHLVPPNDGGIALGQALAGMYRKVSAET